MDPKAHRTPWIGPLAALLLLNATACDKNGTPPAAGSSSAATTAPTATASATATAAATAAATAPTASASATAPDVEGLTELEETLRKDIPKGSGDYARALALATLHKDGKLPYDELEKAVIALKLPPHKLGDSSRTAYNSLEQENQSYLDEALDGWFVTWESECFIKLLTEDQKRTDSHVVEFVREALLRADLTSRGN